MGIISKSNVPFIILKLILCVLPPLVLHSFPLFMCTWFLQIFGLKYLV